MSMNSCSVLCEHGQEFSTLFVSIDMSYILSPNQQLLMPVTGGESTLFVILFVFKLIVSEVQTSLRSAVHKALTLKDVEEIEG